MGNRPFMDTASEKLQKYLASEGLGDIYPILIYQTQLCRARSRLIKDGIEKFNQYLKENDDDSTIWLHITQIDIISKLFMFLEDYLSFSYYLRTSKKKLPKKIHLQSRESVVWKEIRYLQNLKVDEIQSYLLLQNINELSLAIVDREFVKRILSLIFINMHRKIRELLTFYNEYHRVYNKYKHVLTSFIGTYSLGNNIKNPRIFIRDKYVNKRKKIIKEFTYVLPTDAATIEYYEKVNDDVLEVFLTLLESHVHSIQNCGAAFLIPDGFFVPDEDKRKWQWINRKVNLDTGIPQLSLRIDVKQNEASKMLRAFSNKYIYVTEKDIIRHPQNTLLIQHVAKM